MGQEESVSNHQPHSARHYHLQQRSNKKPTTKIQHEGILKLRSTPFPGCVEIDNDGFPLFLENAQMTLHDLIQSRLYTNRLFPCEDMERLIENVTYTLAYLYESDIVYKDISSHNIYYNSGQFKVLPNDLIEESLYQRAYNQFYGNKPEDDAPDFICLSPELIIALRMREQHIQDEDILHKSNVFIFGLILLEATTLMPSSECFDPTNYDIFDNIISERLQLVEEHYNERVARIIANMIDYDYSERMDLKELAIWINRQLEEVVAEPKAKLNPRQSRNSYSKMMSSSSKSKIFNRELSVKTINQPQALSPGEEDLVSQADNIEQEDNQVHQPEYEMPQQQQVKKSYSRSNMIYVHGYDESNSNHCEDSNARHGGNVSGPKNQVYLHRVAEQFKYVEAEEEPRASYQEVPRKVAGDYERRSSQRNMRLQPQPNFRKTHQNYEEYSRPSKYSGSGLSRDPYPEPSGNDQSYGRLSSHAQNQPVYHHQDHQANPINKYSYSHTIHSDEGVHDYVNKFQDISNIGSFKLRDNIENTATPSLENDRMRAKDHQLPTKGSHHQNKYYPSLNDIQNQTEVTKRLAKHAEIKDRRSHHHQQQGKDFSSNQSKESDVRSNQSINDGSINRIKMEVEKSRKMIEQFRKSEGLTN